MLKRAVRVSSRGLHSQPSRPTLARPAAVVASAATLAAGTLWYLTGPVDLKGVASSPRIVKSSPDDGTFNTLVWGSNKTHILSSDGENDSVRTPVPAGWLENVALRDLALHEQHAACVDARGDVYQWGDGFSSTPQPSSSSPSDRPPKRTLRGKNITRLQLTRTHVFALSASGRIYALSSSAEKQVLSVGAPTPASTPWWGTGWLWGEEEDVDFVEILPSEKLAWGERFVSIAAGSDHLLALTSAGRTFAHPISRSANTHGQLGFRKFDIPEHPHAHTRLAVELTPKSIADPYAKASPAIRRVSSPPSPDEDTRAAHIALAGRDDADIRFSDRLFEVPALRGVHVDQIAAGARTSFVKTTAGRVLGWGANEFGQIGLGSAVTLDTITVPTEVILWRSTPAAMRTTCLDIYAGGDLTFFKVERADGTAMPYVDVLACGNGQWGGLGNAQFSNAQSAPVRARNVSGLLEYSEKRGNLQPVMPQDISVSPTGHVLLTLDTLTQAGPGGAGRDVLAWGANYEYQLGNGRRGSVATPTVLESAGARLMLEKRRAREVRDGAGRVWKRGVEVEQRAVAGWGTSVVYWRICAPA
ncbi:RCC1/BLIP-II [Amylocystis lapponica]|nr:RCC1/BLIP-II [Amylocystis lapponica]